MKKLMSEIGIVRDVAIGAGRLLTSARGEMRVVDYKSATDMVTDLDRHLEEFIVKELSWIFPEDGILAEEGATRPSRSGRTWIVDPLDGTTNYVHGHPFYAISIACVDQDGPLIGVVFAPELGELFSAGRGCGAFLERPGREEPRRLSLANAPPLNRALLGTGFSYLRDEACSAVCDTVKAFLLAGCHGVRRGGSAALDLCYVGAGRLDGYWELRLNPWDIAAGGLIALEAGASIVDLLPGDDWLGSGWLLAAAPGLELAMLPVIRDVMGPWLAVDVATPEPQAEMDH